MSGIMGNYRIRGGRGRGKWKCARTGSLRATVPVLAARALLLSRILI